MNLLKPIQDPTWSTERSRHRDFNQQNQVLTSLAKRGVTVALSRANQSTAELLAHYHLLELIGENRMYPTNRHAIAAFRKETVQATLENTAE